MKSLIVGCSITHGSELISDVYHPLNVEHTYANKLSKHLGFEPNNIAIPGNSNESIFHEAVENLKGHDLLIVGWTSLFRETWINENKNYYFNPNWGCVTDDLTMQDVFVEIRKQVKFVSSDRNMLSELQEYHRLLNLYKFNDTLLTQRVVHYRECLKTLCKHSNIRYIDICLIDNIFNDSVYYNTNQKCRGRHPNKKQHQDIMNLILEFYKI
jgi:hypothetical protein